MIAVMAFAGVVLVASGGDGLSGILEQMRTTKEDAQALVQENIGRGQFLYPPESRRIPMAGRAAAVETLVRFARSHVESPAFAAWYEQFRLSVKPEPPEMAQTAAEQRAAQIASARQAIAELEQQRDAASGDVKEAMQQAVDNAKGMLKEMENQPPDQDAEVDKEAAETNARLRQEHEQQLAAWEKEFPPKNPRPLIARRLKEFLEATEGIDYRAELVSSGDVKMFKNPDYEGKGRPWKLGFRAGQDATEKARLLGREWLAELER